MPNEPENPSQPAPPVPEDVLDPPALERLVASPDDVVPPDAPLKQYVLNEDGPDVMRDLPFGDLPQMGGETPFFTNQEPSAVAWSTEDTDGIPTGLPNLLDLPPLEDRPTTPAVPRERASEVVVQIDHQAVAAARERGYQQAAVAFVAGVVVAVAAWLIFLSQIQ